MSENAIEVRNLTKEYRLYASPRQRLLDALGLLHGGRKPAVNKALSDVSLTIKRGETVGVIGTNGSGKSTLLKIITGVLSPTSGEVNVSGRISALLELGAGFNMEYTGVQNVFLNGAMMGYSDKEIEKRLPSILEFADIGDYAYQPVKTYSSGMFVRLAFAVAINIDPEILIVDEALSVGDVFFQAKCYRKFEEFRSQGKTIIFVSHDLGSIAKYCDRVYLINKGKLLGEGEPKKMIDAYKQVLVGLYDENADETPSAANPDSEDDLGESTLEYGTGDARIVSSCVEDENGTVTGSIIKGTSFTIRMRVEFVNDVANPIFAFTIKNAKGTEISGTNTMYEKAFTDSCKAGDVKEITFTQRADLQGGAYLLSLGVTGFEGTEFKVYHRLYDCRDITVISDKDTVGYYDMNSEVKVSTVERQEANGN